MLAVKKNFLWRDLRLTYYDNELNSERVWLLAHANGYAALCYRFYWNKLHRSGVRVVALDFAGHGFSEGTLKFRNWNFYRDQLAALAEHLSLRNIVGLGHSMGGASLLRFAAHKPEHFTAVVALDPTLLYWPALLYMAILPAPIAVRARQRRSLFESRQKAGKILRRTPSFAAWSDEAFAGYLEACFRDSPNGGVELSCSPELEAKNFQSPGMLSLRQYSRLKTPVHFILPDPSDVCPVARARQLARKNPQSTVQQLKNFGHLFPFTRQEETWQLITKLPGDLLPHRRRRR